MKLKDSIFNSINGGKLAFKSAKEIELSPLFGKTAKARKAVREAIRELVAEGALIADRRGRLSTPEQAGAFTGTVQGNPRGFAFIIPDDKDAFGKDFFVPRSSLGGAYDGDKVLAAPVRGTEDEAYVVKICGRGRKRVVGTIEKHGNSAWLVPDDIKAPEIALPLSLLLEGESGDKALCEITRYRDNSAPIGKVCEILGKSGDFEAEELSIIRSFDLYESFSERAERQAEEAASAPVCADGRRDLREQIIFTVDGADTRDIDDAISLDYKDGKYILGVHIADVSGYVEYRSPLDGEAFARGTSVYFPDRVYPMLPRSLSNGACSLNEGEDRYALSCVMTFSVDGERESYEIFESVIKSRHRTTYGEITAVCDGEKSACEKLGDIVKTVGDMRDLCLILEGRRRSAGEINLEVKEAKIYVGENGEIVIPEYSRTISERMIEQFMIAANEAVADFLTKKGAPCLYRVHENPSPEKSETLLNFVRDLGVNANFDCENVAPADYKKILDMTKDKPFYNVINKVMLRSMQKARYCEKNLGHFGLASKCYCHFTSPIRRYPDLFVHRAVKEILRGGNSLKIYAENAGEAAAELSERERVADEAERAVDDLYKVVYMSEHIGEEFEAIVSGTTDFGVFCELKNTIEGLIPLEYLPDDEYEFFADKFLLKGVKRSFRLGDEIRVRADGCDFGRMRVIFALCD